MPLIRSPSGDHLLPQGEKEEFEAHDYRNSSGIARKSGTLALRDRR